MNEPNDKPFHDWVAQSLHSYRPGYDPRDWATMQRTLRRRRWWRRGTAGGIGLLFIALVGWLLTSPTETVRKSSLAVPVPTVERIVKKPAPDPARPAPTSYLPKQRIRRVTAMPAPQRRPAPAEPALSLSSSARLRPLPTTLSEIIRLNAPVAFSSEEIAIRQQMLTGDFGPDSTSYQTLSRNLRQWPDAVVVCDLTSSMYPYSTQLFAWFKQNARNPAVNGLVFFTDCDSLGRQTQPGGPAGQMFITRERDVTSVLPIMLRAAHNTVQNYDDAENDVEALLAAQRAFPQAKHLILLADNLSRVKDMDRLDAVKKPVHVILCGTTGGDLSQPFQPDYYTIASQTNGSLHTLEDDITPNALSRRTVLRVGDQYYRYHSRKGQFRPTSFSHRPMCLFGFIWL